MSSILPFMPSLGTLIGNNIRAMAQSIPPTPTPTLSPSETPASQKPATQKDIASALESVLSDQPAIGSNARFSSVSITLNNGKGLDIDKAARLISPKPIDGPATSLRGIEITNSATAKTVGERDGLIGSGLAPVWLENYGSITGKKGAGVKLGGDQDDEVLNAGLITGRNGVALDMGGGNDMLIVKHGGRFEGEVDGGTGANQVLLEDAKGGTFDGARRMQHLWVGEGTWTLTGAVEANRQGKVHSGATLINQSTIGGSMSVDPGATYSGGTVGNLDVAGTLRLEPTTRIENDLRMQAGSTLAFTPGTDKALSVGNTANLNGATLNLHVADENDLPSHPVRLINARRVEGQFANITSNLKNVTPELTYKAHDVFVTFKRNDPTVV